MKRRRIIIATMTVGVLLLALLAADTKPTGKLLVLDWAAKSSLAKPPTAILIEFGMKDTTPTDWSGIATVKGAKIVHREGYRFRPKAGDQLMEPDAWKMSSHRGLRVPPNQPAVAKMEGIATIGVVLHLADVEAEASLSLETTGAEKSKSLIPLKDVLAGKPASMLDGRGTVRLISTALPIATGKTEDDFPAACYGPDGTLWVAWIGYHVKDESRRIEQANLKEQPNDFKAFFTPEFGDQLFVKYYKDGKWSDAIAVTDDKQDLVRCAIAVEKDGMVWLAYSAHRDGRYITFVKSITVDSKSPNKPVIRFGDPHRFPKGVDDGSELAPMLYTHQNGQIRLAFLETADSESFFRLHSKELRRWESGWSDYVVTNIIGIQSAMIWQGDLTVGSAGDSALVFDVYRDGNFNIDANVLGSKETQSHHIASTSRHEARPSATYDPQGRLWIAYEEGPELWGKDFGALAPNEGNPLYSSRSVRVVCLENGKLFRPVAELPTSDVPLPKIPFAANANLKYEKAERYAYPKIGIDGKGRVWLTYRQKFGTRYSSHPGSYWLTFARRLDGDKWTDPIELHHSDGLLDHRPVLLPHKDGGLLVVHNTDGRYTTPEKIDNDIYMSYVDLPGEPVAPKLVPHDPGKKNEKLVQRHKQETEAVKRIRDYRVESDGKKYRLLRGEFHRHTEISWDGGPDGSLEDMFRYAIDAAQMDWIGNGDHDNGAGREYAWWLVQKFTDAYHIPGRFVPMFSYERSVAYPHGHRNCVFAQRGVRTLPRLAEPDMEKRVGGVHADDTKMLYRYLHEMNGVCASHTSATSMGTDWRDHDPKVEPFVEIYQGDRMSYEKEEAPRAGFDPKSGKEPANIAGWFPKGFINLALGEKGHKLGFEASSDHWSTHISYCIVLSEKLDRESLLDAMRKRHVYGATDDIICDVRSGNHVMGDEFKAGAAPELQIHIIGTKDLKTVEVLKDSAVVAELKCNGRDCKETWTDPQPSEGVHYYYFRVRQSDGELAWTSPMWIEYRK